MRFLLVSAVFVLLFVATLIMWSSLGLLQKALAAFILIWYQFAILGNEKANAESRARRLARKAEKLDRLGTKLRKKMGYE